MKQKSELMSDVFVKSKVIVILGSLTIKAKPTLITSQNGIQSALSAMGFDLGKV